MSPIPDDMLVLEAIRQLDDRIGRKENHDASYQLEVITRLARLESKVDITNGRVSSAEKRLDNLDIHVDSIEVEQGRRDWFMKIIKKPMFWVVSLSVSVIVTIILHEWVINILGFRR